MKNQELFDLIDESYKEDLSNQPVEYKECLFQAAKELLDETDEVDVCVLI